MWECDRTTKASTKWMISLICCLRRSLRLCKSVLVAVEFKERDFEEETPNKVRTERLQIRCLSENLRIQQACSCSTTNLNTWNRYVHEVSSVTSVVHFHAPKLSMQAPHYTWNDQGVVTWKISGEHQMPWLLSMRTTNCIKGRPCNVKTIEWAPKFLPTFLAQCYFENFSVGKLSVMSSVRMPYFAVSTSVLPSKDQFVHAGAYSSRKSTAEFEALPFAKGQYSDEGMDSSYTVMFYVRTRALDESFN